MCTIRKARLPDDKPLILDFIVALQRYESSLEPNHLIDHVKAEEYFDWLLERRGAIFMADDDGGHAIGWAVANGFASMRIDLLARNQGAAHAYAKAGYLPYCQEVKKRLVPMTEEVADARALMPLKFMPAKRLPLSAA